MRRTLVASALCVAVLGACGTEREATPTAAPLPALDDADLAKAVLTSDDVGEGWTEDEDAAPNTVQIGGRVGAANVTNPVAQSTTSFTQKPGTGSVSNSVFLMASEDIARAVMDAHDNAADDKRWRQDREDGGRSTFTNKGTVEGLVTLGDDDFSAKLIVNVKEASGEEAERTVEYVVYRDGALLSFVVAQDAGVAPFAKKQIARLNDVLAGAATATPPKR